MHGPASLNARTLFMPDFLEKVEKPLFAFGGQQSFALTRRDAVAWVLRRYRLVSAVRYPSCSGKVVHDVGVRPPLWRRCAVAGIIEKISELDRSLTGFAIPKSEAITGSRDCNRVIPAAV